MSMLRTFFARPSLPENISKLGVLAKNLWWCWHPELQAIYRELDASLWDAEHHNPLSFLRKINQSKLNALSQNTSQVARIDAIFSDFQAYIQSHKTWFTQHGAQSKPLPKQTPAEQFPNQRIAYFSAEFGISESVPVYSGGLGVLAGDHLKSASDLGLPLCAVSLMYREAFRQSVDAQGRQQEAHPINDMAVLPIYLQKNEDGTPILVSCELPNRTLFLQVWRMDIGRVPLFFLDADIDQNSADDRKITYRLYGGDNEMRIQQEIVLGIGGLRALTALNFTPTVCHMNEGHSAFLALERVRALMQETQLSFAQACEVTSAGNVFTTHTPVPAGNDRFSPDMIEKYFSSWYADFGIPKEQFLALGREETKDASEHYCMTVLALKLSAKSNGVAQLHGQVSRTMWKKLYPGVPTKDIPIDAITNGIHHATFISDEMRALYDQYLGAAWRENPDAEASWNLSAVPDEAIWNAHEKSRLQTILFTRKKVAAQLLKRNAPSAAVVEAASILDPHALTIGFARRFATYKRATLIFKDAARLAKIMNAPGKPVQFIFAGKSHQKDEPGKEIIRQLIASSNLPEFKNRIIFIEDYDMDIARELVKGVDIWLNTPVRPMEASGTSGMKSVANGGIHVSISDGWWAEGFAPGRGWVIGENKDHPDKETAEKYDSDALYSLLETEIVPAFYTRDLAGIPHQWVSLMRKSISELAPFFNTHRMVREYFERKYEPVQKRFAHLSAHKYAKAKELATFKSHIRSAWHSVSVKTVDAVASEVAVGEALSVRASVDLGSLSPAEVNVQATVYSVQKELVPLFSIDLKHNQISGSVHIYTGLIVPTDNGKQAFAIRILPKHTDLETPFDIVPVIWG